MRVHSSTFEPTRTCPTFDITLATGYDISGKPARGRPGRCAGDVRAIGDADVRLLQAETQAP